MHGRSGLTRGILRSTRTQVSIKLALLPGTGLLSCCAFFHTRARPCAVSILSDPPPLVHGIFFGYSSELTRACLSLFVTLVLSVCMYNSFYFFFHFPFSLSTPPLSFSVSLMLKRRCAQIMGDGRPKRLLKVCAGGTFGEVGFFLRTPQAFRAVAREACHLHTLDRVGMASMQVRVCFCY